MTYWIVDAPALDPAAVDEALEGLVPGIGDDLGLPPELDIPAPDLDLEPNQ